MHVPLFETHNFFWRIPVFEAPRKLCLLEILLLHNSTLFFSANHVASQPLGAWTRFRMGLKWVFSNGFWMHLDGFEMGLD